MVMATSSTHDKLCEPCQQVKKKVKVRSFCFECQELLCKECSDIHLTFKLSRNHNLIDLIPLSKRSIKGDQNVPESTTADDSADNSSDFVDDELSSDFLEHIAITKDTVLYGAQVAVDHPVARSSVDTDTRVDPKQMKLNKIVDFDALNDTKKEKISGITSLSDKIIVVVTVDKLKLFNQNGGYLSSSVLQALKYIYAIATVNDSMFVVGGIGKKLQLCSYDDDKLHEGSVFNVDHDCDAICYNGTFYGVLHQSEKCITVLDKAGEKVRNFSVSKARGKQLTLENGIQMDKTTHDIYVPCNLEGILCKSIKGETLWFKSFPSTYTIRGLIQLHSVLCVAHFTTCSLELMSKNGEYFGTLMEDKGMRSPEYLHFCEKTKKLYVTFGRIQPIDKAIGQISIFEIDSGT